MRARKISNAQITSPCFCGISDIFGQDGLPGTYVT